MLKNLIGAYTIFSNIRLCNRIEATAQYLKKAIDLVTAIIMVPITKQMYIITELSFVKIESKNDCTASCQVDASIFSANVSLSVTLLCVRLHCSKLTLKRKESK